MVLLVAHLWSVGLSMNDEYETIRDQAGVASFETLPRYFAARTEEIMKRLRTASLVWGGGDRSWNYDVPNTNQKQ
jgi:hypothetical protein